MTEYRPNIKQDENGLTISIIVSRNCNLRCSYCYVHKHKEKVFDLDKIMDSLDYCLTELANGIKSNDTSLCKLNHPIISIYPEAWLIPERTNSIIINAYKLINSRYKQYSGNHMVSLGTNGVNMEKEIQALKYIENLSVAVTIDGVKEAHDLYRVFADGRGSWDIVKSNIHKYQKQFRIYSTKVTIGPQTIKYMFDDCLFLWEEMNMNDIMMNVPFEDIWGTLHDKNKALEKYEEQIEKITDYVIRNKCWENHKYVSVIGSAFCDDSNKPFMNNNYCGGTQMRSIDCDGSLYPCFRFLPFSLTRITGDRTWKLKELSGWYSKENTRAIKLMNLIDALPQKCFKCNLVNRCPMCIANAYDELGSIFERTTHHCEFVKIQNKYANKLDAYIKGDKLNESIYSDRFKYTSHC